MLAGLKPVHYRPNGDLSFNVNNVISQLDDDTAAVIVNSPANPTGRVINKSDFEELYSMCKEKGVWIISDEAYENIVYAKEHFSIGTLEDKPGLVKYSVQHSTSTTLI